MKLRISISTIFCLSKLGMSYQKGTFQVPSQPFTWQELTWGMQFVLVHKMSQNEVCLGYLYQPKLFVQVSKLGPSLTGKAPFRCQASLSCGKSSPGVCSLSCYMVLLLVDGQTALLLNYYLSVPRHFRALTGRRAPSKDQMQGVN